VDESTARPARPDEENTEASERLSALLLDLSGNREAAAAWARSQLPGLDIRTISKADLKWESKAMPWNAFVSLRLTLCDLHLDIDCRARAVR